MIKDTLKKEYQIEPQVIERINFGVINDNYYIKNHDGREYLFKKYKNDQHAKIEFEIELYKILEGNNFPAPKIVTTVNNQRLLKADGNYILFKYIPGRMLNSVEQNIAKQVGSLTGQLHNIFNNIKENVNIEKWEPDDITNILFNHGNEVAERDFDYAYKFVQYVQNEYQKLKLDADLPQGMTHQDIKPENIIIDSDGKISFIDFNNCYTGCLLSDVMTFPIWAMFDFDNKLDISLFASYIKAYDQSRNLLQIEKSNIMETFKFRLLREAYVWPYRWLKADKARRNAWMFVNRYKDIISNEDSYNKEIEKLWQN